MTPKIIDVEALAAMSNWSPKALRNALDRGASGAGLKPRTKKIGGRFAFAIADVFDLALARPLIARGVKIATAIDSVRPITNQLFALGDGSDIEPEEILGRACEKILEVHFIGDDLVDVRLVESLTVLAELQRAPQGANVRFGFDDGLVVLLFSIGAIAENVFEKAKALGTDLSNIEHGAFR